MLACPRNTGTSADHSLSALTCFEGMPRVISGFPFHASFALPDDGRRTWIPAFTNLSNMGPFRGCTHVFATWTGTVTWHGCPRIRAFSMRWRSWLSLCNLGWIIHWIIRSDCSCSLSDCMVEKTVTNQLAFMSALGSHEESILRWIHRFLPDPSEILDANHIVEARQWGSAIHWRTRWPTSTFGQNQRNHDTVNYVLQERRH